MVENKRLLTYNEAVDAIEEHGRFPIDVNGVIIIGAVKKAQDAKTLKKVTDDLCPIIYFIDQEFEKGKYKDLLITVKAMIHDYIVTIKREVKK